MLKKIYKTMVFAIRKISQDEIFMYAAQGSFYIITASIPFMMLFLALLNHIVPIGKAEIIAIVQSIMPKLLRGFVEVIINELFSKSTTVISITGMMAVWSSSRGIAAAERGIVKVYGVSRKINVVAEFARSLIYTVIFLIVLLMILLFALCSGIIYDFLNMYFNWFVGIETIMNILIFLGVTFFVAFSYRVFVGKKIKFSEHIYGALFASVGLFTFSVVFSVYVEKIADYSYMYGSLTVLVLILLWVYSSMIIFLLGAEVNVFVARKKASL